jgi:predicted MPP superfamily phosphohydrolase
MTSPSAVEPEQSRPSLSQLPIGLILRGLAMVSLVFGLMGWLHFYVGKRLIADVGLTGWPATLGWTVLGALFVGLPLGMMAGRRRRTALARALQWMAHVWLGTFGTLIAALAATDLLSFGLKAALWPVNERLWSQAQAAIALGTVLPALLWAYRTARGQARIERVTVAVKGLPAAFEGFKIAQISDVHIGDTLDRRFMQQVVDQVNGLSPDLVAITGDLIDGLVSELREEVAPLAALRGREGVFYVTGNHEYYHGGPAWEAEVRRLGPTVLHNEHRVLARGEAQLVVGGVTDHDGGHFGEGHASRPDLAFAGAPDPDSAPRILLAHQPRSARAAAGLGVSLQLSGHTHGGQMFPWMVFVRLQQPVVSGMRELYGVPVYTNRGTGYWGPPFRLGPRPEITEVTLKRA